MAIWYEGNLNLSENRREQNGVTYYIRGVREVEGIRFERYAINTHFIERGEDYIEVARRYILPLYLPGDIAAMGEKVISMCQNNTVEMKDVSSGSGQSFYQGLRPATSTASEWTSLTSSSLQSI